MSALNKLPAVGDAPWVPVEAEKLLSGAPRTRTWVQYDNPAQNLSAGEWEATPGKWRVAYGEWEYVQMLSGACILCGDDGRSIAAGPGDAFVIEPGFTGTWEVVEPMRKRWVIREL